MPPRFKKLIKMLLGFFLAVVFLYLAFRGVSFSDLWTSLKDVDYLWVSLLIPITIVSHWLRAVRWSYLLAPVKEHTSHHRLFSAVMIGFMVNNVLPRVGEIMRAFAVGRSEGISKTTAFGTVVVERILDMVTFLFILSVVLFFSPSALDPFFSDVDAVRPFFLVGSLLSFGIFAILFFKGEILFRLLGVLKRIVPNRFVGQYEDLVNSFLTGFGVAKMHNKLAMIIVLSLLIYFFYALSLYVPFYAFKAIAGENLGFGAAVVLLMISTMAFALPAPGALGTYHSFITIALTQLYGIDGVTALSFAIITHEAGYIITTVVGLFYFLKDHLRFSEVVKETTDPKTV